MMNKNLGRMRRDCFPVSCTVPSISRGEPLSILIRLLVLDVSLAFLSAYFYLTDPRALLTLPVNYT